MNTPLPRCRIGEELIEAFPITAIEFPDIGVRLRGPNGIQHGVRKEYLREHSPYVGGYYLRFADGEEFFMDADEFELHYRPVERPKRNPVSILVAWPYVL